MPVSATSHVMPFLRHHRVARPHRASPTAVPADHVTILDASGHAAESPLTNAFPSGARGLPKLNSNQDSPRKRVVVIGGGLSGLAASYDLVRSGHHLTILEAAPDFGGLASSFRLEAIR